MSFSIEGQSVSPCHCTRWIIGHFLVVFFLPSSKSPSHSSRPVLPSNWTCYVIRRRALHADASCIRETAVAIKIHSNIIVASGSGWTGSHCIGFEWEKEVLVCLCVRVCACEMPNQLYTNFYSFSFVPFSLALCLSLSLLLQKTSHVVHTFIFFPILFPFSFLCSFT